MPQIYNLPGTSSNINIKELIDKLVKAESKRIDTYEKEKDFLDKRKSALVELNSKLKKLQKEEKNLYGFRSPFEDKIANSSNSNVLTATATRIATPSEVNIKVDQLAKNERIVSDSVSNTEIFDPLELNINVGKNRLNIEFDGGNLSDLADAINKAGKGMLTAKLAKVTSDTSVLIVETKKTGESYRINIDDKKTLKLFEKIGLFEESRGFSLKPKIEDQYVLGIGGSKPQIEEKNIILKPESKAALKLTKPVPVKDSVYIYFKARVKNLPKEEKKPVQWPELEGIGSVKVKDIEIEGGRPVNAIKKEEKKEKKIVIDNNILGVKEDNRINKIEIKDLGEEFKEYRVKITDLVKGRENITELLLLNNSTNRDVIYSDFKIVDTSEPGGVKPKHVVQEPQNAIVEIDGVRIERDSNDIDDALKGVTLHLNSTSDKPVKLNIDYDYEKITKKIIDLIEKYNDALKYINEKTKISATGSLTEKNKVGILAGDITVESIKSKLQLIMMNPYPTDKGKELSLLAQIGISMGKSGSSWTDIKGGYLQVDEDKFIDAFKKYPDEIKQLFGSDTNKDMIVDNGVAYKLDKILNGYTSPNQGIITYKIKNTDNEIKNQDKKIEDWNEHLEEYRKNLERKFTVMQEALHDLERNKKSIENFNKQMGGK